MNNDEDDNKFTWGETAIIKKTAPEHLHPGEIVSICGMTKIETNRLASLYNSQIDEWVYTVEFIGGKDMEIPERYLEKKTHA